MGKVAIFIDGAFYNKRANYFYGAQSPEDRAKELVEYCKRHTKDDKKVHMDLYRIFYYDCPPSKKKIFHPLLQRVVDLSKTEQYTWTENFLQELKHQRQFALRLGRLAEEQAFYTIKPRVIKKLMNGNKSIDELSENDFVLNIDQKGVDMRIGVDIASVSIKKQVERIILISGDSDFVPAAKLARREGVDFILDPMRNPIKEDLFEHIDGMRTKAPKLPIVKNEANEGIQNDCENS